MTIDEISKLRNIHKLFDFTVYVADCTVPDAAMYSKVYHPIIIDALNKFVYDYTVTSKNYLKIPHITSKTTKSLFFGSTHNTRIKQDLSNLSIDQVQEIIDRNNYLFTQITNQVRENELLDQINIL